MSEQSLNRKYGPLLDAMITTARTEGAKAERERIVAWLREEADMYVVDPACGALEDAADQIEKGI